MRALSLMLLCLLPASPLAGCDGGCLSGSCSPAPADSRRQLDASPPPPTDRGAAYAHEDISPATLEQWLTAGKSLTLVDVREPSELGAGFISGAINLAWTSGVLQQSLAQIPTSKPVVVYCASGVRSNSAATFLAEQGYRPVHDLLGGFKAWVAAGYPVAK